MRFILTVLFVVFFLILSLPFLGIEWLIARHNQESADLAQLHAVQWALRICQKISGLKLTVNGLENIPEDEPVLYIGNHRGFFDIVTTYTLVKGRTGFVAKISLKKVPLLSTYMERLHCLFIDRDDIKQSLKVILAAIDKVKNGISIVIFPEGTRCKEVDHPEMMLPFKEGSFKIATKTGCKIIPMAIIGTDQLFEAHLPWIRPGKVTITFGEPIDPKTLTREEQKRIGAYTQSVVQKMLNDQLGIEE